MKTLIFLLLFLCITAVVTAFDGNDAIKIYSFEEKDRGEVRYYADNLNYSPYQLKIDFVVFDNLKADKDLPFFTVLKPRSKQQYLFTLRSVNPAHPSRLRIQSAYTRGDPNASHDNGYLYLFPFEHGKKHALAQGYDGTSTHKGLNALDFNMEIGTAVVAARDGVVVAVQQNSQRGGMDSAYEKEGNHIILLHDDNTFSIYAHLKYRGSVVSVGDSVRAGDLIGYSGNTGMSSGPHLHFEVYKAAHLDEGPGKISIPTKFLDYDGTAVDPEEGLWYYATHPGKESYEVILGRNYKDEYFINFKEALPTDNDFRIETKIVDDTVLIFARNGFERTKELTFNFSEATNMTASKKLPHTQRIPPNAKVYIMLIKPARAHETWQYRYEYEVR